MSNYIVTAQNGFKAHHSFQRPNDTIMYTSGDSVSDSTTSPTPITFNGSCRNSGGFCRITNVTLATNNQIGGGAFQLLFLNVYPLLLLDNAAFSLDNAEVIEVTGSISFNTSIDYNAGELFITETNIICTPETTILFGALICTTSYTPISSEQYDITVYGEYLD